MWTMERPETLIELLASYRHVPLPTVRARRRALARMAAAMRRNCELTAHFTGRMLRDLEEEGEEAYALCAAREEAVLLKKQCASLADGHRGRNSRQEVESLRRQYDNFTGSVRHLFHLLDRNLAGRLDGVL